MITNEILEAARETIVSADEERAMEIIEEVRKIESDLIELLRFGFEEGNAEVSRIFEKGLISLPELIFSSEVMKRVTITIENYLGKKSVDVKGRLLIATVSGDVHDIGKGIVASILINNGIEVIDIGRDVPVDTIIEKAEEYKVDIIGTSALLTTTLVEQKKLEEALRKRGLRDKYKTMVGGAPCTAHWAKKIGADAYTGDANEAVSKALELLEK